jgi:chorismate mutase
MSPIKRNKLSKIRIELDKLDDYLIKIIKKRTYLVKKVLELKDKKNQIIDQKRINLILKNIKRNTSYLEKYDLGLYRLRKKEL